jgi:hypothetical protein
VREIKGLAVGVRVVLRIGGWAQQLLADAPNELVAWSATPHAVSSPHKKSLMTSQSSLVVELPP